MSDLDAREPALAAAVREAAFGSKEETHTGSTTEAQDSFPGVKDGSEVQSSRQEVPESIQEEKSEVVVAELVGEDAMEVDAAKEELKTEDLHAVQDPAANVVNLQAEVGEAEDVVMNEEDKEVTVEGEEVTPDELTPGSTRAEEQQAVEPSPIIQQEESNQTPGSVEESSSSTEVTPPTSKEDNQAIEETQQHTQPVKRTSAPGLDIPVQNEQTEMQETSASPAPMDEPTLATQEVDIPPPKVESTSVTENEHTDPAPVQETTPSVDLRD